MDLRELRNLQEAYQEVYQLDEISTDLALRASKKAGEVAGQLSALGGSKEKVLKKRQQQQRLYGKQAEKRKKKVTSVTPMKYNLSDYLPKKEEFDGDIFDYILEYLVAKGYADTNKEALYIMANMGEELTISILEGKEPIPYDKIVDKVEKSHAQFKDLVKGEKPGDLAKAAKLTQRVGKMKSATTPKFDKKED